MQIQEYVIISKLPTLLDFLSVLTIWQEFKNKTLPIFSILHLHTESVNECKNASVDERHVVLQLFMKL